MIELIGWACAISGGILLALAIMVAALAGLTVYGQKVWDRLQAVYDVKALRDHLRALEAEGKLSGRLSDKK